MAIILVIIALVGGIISIFAQLDLARRSPGEPQTTRAQWVAPLAFALIAGAGSAGVILDAGVLRFFGLFSLAHYETSLQRKSSALPADEIYASRIFAGPDQYPPTDFAAYGIVAFPARATADDRARYEMICNAYVAGLNHVTDLDVPFDEQMVTVWPIETNTDANRINRMPRSDSMCPEAVRHYGLKLSLEAIKAAQRGSNRLDGLGPFLLAWSPSETIGKPDALVLVSDLSNVTIDEQAKEVFVRWRDDIQKNHEIWKDGDGWDLDKLRILIRNWADNFGPNLLKVIDRKE